MIINLIDMNRFATRIQVTCPAGSEVTATLGTTTLRRTATDGTAAFRVPRKGTWTITATQGENSATATVEIDARNVVKTVALAYNQIPEFTYTGNFKIVDDSGNEIASTTENNWNIRFLSSGVLTITSLGSAVNGIDLFLVGGGGGGGTSIRDAYDGAGFGSGGGGGGYTKTVTAISLGIGTYTITTGAGGAAGAAGGETSVTIEEVKYAAAGGRPGSSSGGGAGGSGGGAGVWSQGRGQPGGADGADGTGYSNSGYPSTGMSAGKGQGKTTKAFRDATAASTYSEGGGGGGGILFTASATAGGQGQTGRRGANTGDGGRGKSYNNYAASAGNSGIMIMRGHRAA